MKEKKEEKLQDTVSVAADASATVSEGVDTVACGARQRPLNGWLVLGVIVLLLLIDQVIKIEVKTQMCLGESIRITPWFYIDFIENNGMAYGMTFFNKLTLSLFRLAAIIAIGWYLWRVVRRGTYRRRYVFLLTMILAGAIGNMLDSMFYGLVFSSSTPFEVSRLVPFGEGYAPFLQGKVVDMFYFPLIVTTWPGWVPGVGGETFIFFSPVFNFADACISVGIVLLLIFCRKDLEGLGASRAAGKSADGETSVSNDKCTAHTAGKSQSVSASHVDAPTSRGDTPAGAQAAEAPRA